MTQQQDAILTTGATLPRLRAGTLEEQAVSTLMKLTSHMAAWIVPTLNLTSLQWVRKFNRDQIFDSLQLFQLFQNDPLDHTGTQMVFLFHLLGCHDDVRNCTKRPSIFALKKNLLDGVIIGVIAYPRLSVHLTLLSVK